MARAAREKEKLARRKGKRFEILPLEPVNYKILGAGVLVVILGYVALGMEPWDGFMALTVAPILLVIGYCVLLPLGIIYRRKKEEVPPAAATVPQEPLTQK